MRAGTGGDYLRHDKPARTDVVCTECSKLFVTTLDYTINGNHVMVCPWCKHEHFRVIVDGRITEDRWSSAYGDIKDKARVGVYSTKIFKVREKGDAGEPVGDATSVANHIRLTLLFR